MVQSTATIKRQRKQTFRAGEENTTRGVLPKGSALSLISPPEPAGNWQEMQSTEGRVEWYCIASVKSAWGTPRSSARVLQQTNDKKNQETEGGLVD